MNRRTVAMLLAVVLTLLTIRHAPALADDPTPDSGCTVSGGALSIASADTGDGDFAVFGLFDATGEQLARQYIPVYNPDASAELMLTPVGSGTTVRTGTSAIGPFTSRSRARASLTFGSGPA